jgi:hypothetical protein
VDRRGVSFRDVFKLSPSRRIVASLLLVFLLSPSPASAQDEAAIAAARELGQQGSLDAKAGRCEEAVDKLSRAKKIIAVPSILVPLGECQIALGRIVVGTENLQAAAREFLPADAPEAFVKAQKRARQILPEALKKLARLRLDVAAPPGVAITILDNGEPIDSVLVGVDRPADPTTHKIEVSAPGFLKATAEVTLASGESKRLELKLEPDPNAIQPPPPVDPPTDPGPRTTPTPPPVVPPPPPPPASSPLVPVGGAILGVGGASLLVGAIFGGLASSKKSGLDEVCVEKVCPDAEQSNIDDLVLFGDVSTGMLIAGGVVAGVGLGLLIAGASSSSEPTVGLFLKPSGATLEGRF